MESRLEALADQWRLSRQDYPEARLRLLAPLALAPLNQLLLALADLSRPQYPEHPAVLADLSRQSDPLGLSVQAPSNQNPPARSVLSALVNLAVQVRPLTPAGRLRPSRQSDLPVLVLSNQRPLARSDLLDLLNL